MMPTSLTVPTSSGPGGLDVGSGRLSSHKQPSSLCGVTEHSHSFWGPQVSCRPVSGPRAGAAGKGFGKEFEHAGFAHRPSIDENLVLLQSRFLAGLTLRTQG